MNTQNSKNSRAGSPDQAAKYKEVHQVKNTLLLATALFLISAPAPNSNDIAEITSNFIVPQDVPGLQASEESLSLNLNSFKQSTKQGLAVQNNTGTAQAGSTKLKVQPAKD